MAYQEKFLRCLLQKYQTAQENVWKIEKFRNKAKNSTQRQIADMRMPLAMEELGKYGDALNRYPDLINEVVGDKNYFAKNLQPAIDKAKQFLDISHKQNVELTEEKGLFGKLGDGIKMSMSRMYSFGMLGYKVIGKISRTFQKIIGYAQQLDKAMVNIQIVTGKTRSEAFDLMSTYNNLAKELGSTTSEVANSANVWFNESRDHIKPL